MPSTRWENPTDLGPGPQGRAGNFGAGPKDWWAGPEISGLVVGKSRESESKARDCRVGPPRNQENFRGRPRGLAGAHGNPERKPGAAGRVRPEIPRISVPAPRIGGRARKSGENDRAFQSGPPENTENFRACKRAGPSRKSQNFWPQTWAGGPENPERQNGPTGGARPKIPIISGLARWRAWASTKVWRAGPNIRRERPGLAGRPARKSREIPNLPVGGPVPAAGKTPDNFLARARARGSGEIARTCLAGPPGNPKNFRARTRAGPGRPQNLASGPGNPAKPLRPDARARLEVARISEPARGQAREFSRISGRA